MEEKSFFTDLIEGKKKKLLDPNAVAWAHLRPDPKSLQGTRAAPKVSSPETMAAAAAAGYSLLLTAQDGDVAGVWQALALGPVQRGRARGSEQGCWGASGDLTVLPFLSPVTLSFHFHFLSPGATLSLP